MKRLRGAPGDGIPLWLRYVPAVVWILWGLQTVLVVRELGRTTKTVDNLSGFGVSLALSYFALWIYGWVVALATPRRRVLALLCQTGFVVLYAVLLLFRWHAGGHPDWSLFWRFRVELVNHNVRSMIGSLLGWRSYLFLGLALLAVLALEGAGAYLTRLPRPNRRWLALVGFGGVAAILAFGPPITADEISASLRGLKGTFALSRLIPSDANLPPFPYVRPGESGASPPLAELPNVFVIAIESFNAHFAEARTPDGREYTPFFNSLIPRGVYVENFYGNSMETPRGHFPLLCGIWPIASGRVYGGLLGKSFHCLPEIFRDYGYQTVFDQADASIDFDDTGRFWSRNGFSVRRASMDKERKRQSEAAVWGWGVQDDVFFEEFFAFLDVQQAAALAAHSGTPQRYFAFLATISSHFPFLQIPANLRYLYPGAVGGAKGYGNAIYLADSYLRTFFRGLESRPYLTNSIVIVTGDHSHPAGEHGHNIAAGYNEEIFRTPLLILWEGHLEARRIGGELWSQIDVAPTILDLLGIHATNHFVGRSILRGFDPRRDRVHLIQPFAGIYLAVISGDLKYVFHLATDREYLFNLRQDPLEERNLIHSYRGTEVLLDFRREIGRILLNERLVADNRVWPAAKTGAGAKFP